MGLFATRARRSTADPEAALPSGRLERVVPQRLVAVAEAWASGSGSGEACEFAGRGLAQDGASLDEVLAVLRDVSRTVVGQDPSYDDVRALCRGWSESTLSYLHQLSCDDPMTGLASLAHLRTTLFEFFRGELDDPQRVSDSRALVVVDLGGVVGASTLSHALRLTRVGETVRTVFPAAPVGRVGHQRIVLVARRDDRLGRRVKLLKRMLEAPARVWIEGIPPSDTGAALLLDELSRD